MNHKPDNETPHPAASTQPTPSDALAQPAELALRKRQRTEDAARRFSRLIKQYANRQDLAWWPEDPKPDPCGRDELFFYRPGQLLVQAAELPVVKRVLRELGVEYCAGHDDREHPEQVVRLLVSSREPVPVLVRRLRCYGLESNVVGPNHVLWPSDTMFGVPWLSGGADSVPAQMNTGPTPVPGSRGKGVKVAVFDSGLLPDWDDKSTARWWLTNVQPIGPADVEGQGGDPDGPDLDIYDSHATFVTGVLKCAAPEATVLVRNVLSELGAVDDHALQRVIHDTLETDRDVKLVNLSLGGTTLDNDPPLAMTQLVNAHPHVVFVAAAGNNGPSGAYFWPAALPNVVGVGALRDGSTRAWFSNTRSADVWALGVGVVNAFGRGELNYPDGTPHEYSTGLASWSGTSFAAPLVTGVLCDYVKSNTGAAGLSGVGAVAWLGGVGTIVSAT